MTECPASILQNCVVIINTIKLCTFVITVKLFRKCLLFVYIFAIAQNLIEFSHRESFASNVSTSSWLGQQGWPGWQYSLKFSPLTDAVKVSKKKTNFVGHISIRIKNDLQETENLNRIKNFIAQSALVEKRKLLIF